MKHGFLLVDKPQDITSFGVCSKTRKAYGIKKVGHTGTLDPFATGLLIIAIGKATKLIPFLDKAEKTYTTTVSFGVTTNTLDTESEEIKDENEWKMPTQEELQKVIDEHFLGELEQIPPQFSAIRKDGVHAYELARKGEKIDIPPRQTEVVHCQVLKIEGHTAQIILRVRAGFYVRAFARDIAQKCGTIGYCSQLRRTHINDISVNDAVQIEDFPAPLTQPAKLIDLPLVQIPTDRLPDLNEGRTFPLPDLPEGKFLLMLDERTIGVGENIYNKVQPRVVF